LGILLTPPTIDFLLILLLNKNIAVILKFSQNTPAKGGGLMNGVA